MTVPLQRGSMAMLQPPRSRFMITDILGGGGGGGGVAAVGGSINGGDSDRRSVSPQGPRDLSVPPRHLHHLQQQHHHLQQHHHHLQQQQQQQQHDDSDSDSSGQLDDQSICSNGK